MSIKEFLKRALSTPTPPLQEQQCPAGTLHWTCNICGTANAGLAKDMDRERAPCTHCGSVMRFRTLAAVLSLRLFGEVKILSELQPGQPIRGVGMSDAHCYGGVLAEKLQYTNTYYHCEPLLDIMQPAQQWLGNNDFVITSDVFEHTPPPAQQAFDNLYKLLKPGGVVIFSVPYMLMPNTREHFPNLHDFKIRQDEQGEWVLDNVTKDGVHEEFRKLCFHGGPGSTLEMREFAQSAVEEHFRRAGFVDLRIHNEPYFEHGIFWLHPWSLVMSVVRPA